MSGRAAVLRRMDVEWSALQHDEQAVASCRRWAAGSDALAGCTRPAEVLDRVARAPDVVLGHLLGELAAGERLAGRVVLQALLPKVVRMAAVDRTAGVDEYVTAMWCEIAAYPLARRPTSVAANLALDTLKAVRRERYPVVDVVTSPHLVVLAADRRPAQVVGSPSRGTRRVDVVEVLAQARHHRLLDAATGALLHSVYADGLTGESAARRHGLSPGAVRTRCSRAVKVLAQNADLLVTR